LTFVAAPLIFPSHVVGLLLSNRYRCLIRIGEAAALCDLLSTVFFFGWDLLFFRPPSDPLQVRFLGLEIRVHFSDSPTPKVCHQDFSFTADPLSRFRFGAADLFRCSSHAPGIRVPA
jgi:hypothetical protein